MWGWTEAPAPAWVRELVGGAVGDLPMDQMGEWTEEIMVREARSWRSGQATGQDKTGEVQSPPFRRQRR